MSKTTNPVGFRLGINKYWNNRFFMFDYSAGVNRQLYIQRILLGRFKAFNINLVNFEVFSQSSGLLIDAKIFITPKDIREFVSAQLYRNFLKDFSKQYKFRPKSFLRRKAYKSARVLSSLIYRFYFVILLAATVELEFFLTQKLQTPVSIRLFNLYYLTKIPYVQRFLKVLDFKLKHFTRYNKDFGIFLKTMTVGFLTLSPLLIGQAFVKRFETVRKHSGVVQMFLNVLRIFISLRISNLVGLKLKISGKFNGRLRAINKVFVVGHTVPAQGLVSWIEYAFLEAFSYTGVFGIKLWGICGRKPI
jgi:hypothetical protein